MEDTVDFTTQLAELARQQKLAQALRGRAQDYEQSIGGHGQGANYVPTAPTQFLAQIINNIGASRAEGKVTEQQKSIDQAMQQHAQQWRSSLPQAIAARAEQAGPPLPEGSPELAAQPAQPVTMGQVLQKTMAASGNPLLKNDSANYEKYAMGQIDREDKQQQARDQLATQQVLGRERLEETKRQHEEQVRRDQANEGIRRDSLKVMEELRRQGLTQSKAFQDASLELRRLGLDNKGDKAGEKLSAEQERAGERLSTKASLIAPMVHSAQKVQDMLDTAGNKSIAGMGYTGMLPGVLLSKEGNVNRAQVKMFANAVLRNQAGLSQTLSETENANLEMLSNGKYSEKEFRASWPNLMEKVNASVNATRAGYHPDVVKTFEERGGYLSPVKSKAVGARGLTPAEEAELAARKARAGQ